MISPLTRSQDGPKSSDGRPLLALPLALGLLSCAPQAEQAQCSVDADCVGRDLLCDILAGECIAAETPLPENTGQVPQGDFTDAYVPFFRGRVCMPDAIEGGGVLPIVMDACLHPCLTVDRHNFSFFFDCINGDCTAYVVVYFTVAGSNCPADAFGAFSDDECAYPRQIELLMGGDDETPLPDLGQIAIEIPFLTNADVTGIAQEEKTSSEIRSVINSYPLEEGRVRTVTVGGSVESSPTSCDGGDCPCATIGF